MIRDEINNGWQREKIPRVFPNYPSLFSFFPKFPWLYLRHVKIYHILLLLQVCLNLVTSEERNFRKIMKTTVFWDPASVVQTTKKSQSYLEQKDNPRILKHDFSSRIHLSIFLFIVLQLFKWSNETSWVLLTWKSTKREWPSGLRHYILNWNDPGSNPTRCLARLWEDPTSLQGYCWPSGWIGFKCSD